MSAFENKVAVIVGASSEGGVGWAAAQRLARLGARVVVAARRTEPLQRLAEQTGGTALPCDITDEQSVITLAKTVDERFGHADLLINAAGRPVPGGIATVDTAGLHESTAVEFHGTWFLLKHLPPVMVDGGAIVVISSLSAVRIVPGFVAYAAAKAAANVIVQYAAVELAPRRIRVNAVVPGLIDTPMNAPFRDNAEVMRVLLKEVPLGRMASADEIAAAAQWLCDPDCFATGTLLSVDGGNHLRRAPFPDELPTSTFEKLA